MSRAKELIETQEFATLPAVASKVLSMLDNDEADIRTIATVIETDAALTLKILRVANSPLYATRAEVNSIHQAILNLGLNRLTNIVLGVSIFSKFLISSNSLLAAIMDKFWWHCSSTGMIAKSLSTKLKKTFKEAEFIGGLIHDIGKLSLIQYNFQMYQEVLTLISSGNSDIEAEKLVFGADHNEVGLEIAKLWKLPQELSEIIYFHTHPERAASNREVISVVRIADLMAEIWGADFFEGIRHLNLEDELSWQILRSSYPELEELDLEIFTFELESDFMRTAEFLKLIKE